MEITRIKRWAFAVVCAFVVTMPMSAQEKELTLQELIPGGKNQKKFVPEDRPLLWVGDDMYLDAEGRETLGLALGAERGVADGGPGYGRPSAALLGAVRGGDGLGLHRERAPYTL